MIDESSIGTITHIIRKLLWVRQLPYWLAHISVVFNLAKCEYDLNDWASGFTATILYYKCGASQFQLDVVELERWHAYTSSGTRAFLVASLPAHP